LRVFNFSFNLIVFEKLVDGKALEQIMHKASVFIKNMQLEMLLWLTAEPERNNKVSVAHTGSI
jgi:hypothetical protein